MRNKRSVASQLLSLKYLGTYINQAMLLEVVLCNNNVIGPYFKRKRCRHYVVHR